MLEIRNIHKSFGSTPVLGGIDLDVNQGDVIAIIGPSGSGKTTLLRCLNYLEHADKGTMVFDQETFAMNKISKKDIARLRKKTAFVFQSYNLFANKTALKNVTEGLIVGRKMPKEKAREIAMKALEKVGLADRSDAYPAQLSGGQQQRVAIARAIAAQPEIIYFDEPTSALDPELTGEVLSVMRSLANEGMTMIVVTHEMSFAKNVSNKIILMENGRIVEQGPSKEFFLQIRKKNVPKHFYSLLTSSNPALYLSGCRWQEYQKGVIFYDFQKSIALLLSGSMLAAAALTGCGSDNTASAVSNTAGKDLLDQIQARGSITVAMEGTWAPWTYHDENDELVGYDVEVAKLIANELGVDVNFVEGEWDGLLAGLDDGRYDIMVNGVGVTPERQEKYDFSIPYAYNKTAVIVRSDYDEIHSMEDLKENTLQTPSAVPMQPFAEKYGAEVKGVDDLNQTIELLLSNRIDATLNTEVTYYDYLKAHPDANIKIAALSDEVEKVAIPVRKGDDTKTLLAAINDALAKLDESGELTALSEKYFGTDISKLEN